MLLNISHTFYFYKKFRNYFDNAKFPPISIFSIPPFLIFFLISTFLLYFICNYFYILITNLTVFY